MTEHEIVRRLREARDNFSKSELIRKIEKYMNYHLGLHEESIRVMNVIEEDGIFHVEYEATVNIPVGVDEEGVSQFESDTEYREITLTADELDLNESTEEELEEAVNQVCKYFFNVPWRECIEYSEDDYYSYHYETRHMSYAGEIMDAAKEDWTAAKMHQYAKTDALTRDLAIERLDMSFNKDAECIIIATTAKKLSDEEIEDLIDWLTGQMSDGWGEGFEQKELATFKYDQEEEVEDEDGETYTETYQSDAYVFGQFWWYDPHHRRYEIKLVGSEVDECTLIKEQEDAGELEESFDISEEMFNIKAYSSEADDFYEKIRGVVLKSIEGLDGVELDDDWTENPGNKYMQWLIYKAQVYTPETRKDGRLKMNPVAPSAKNIIIKNITDNIKLPESTEEVEYEIKVTLTGTQLKVSLLKDIA